MIRELPWTREGRKLAGYPPRAARLAPLAENHAYAAFESNTALRGFCVHWLRRLLHWY